MEVEAAVRSITHEKERRPGTLQAAISRHVVRLVAQYTGRGPTKARTTIRDNVVLCVTQDNMTKAERRLVEEGEEDTVVSVRRRFQTTMAEELIAGIERETGCRVVSFLSDHDAETDHAIEVFVLDRPPSRPVADDPPHAA